jgi:hypothetical protein
MDYIENAHKWRKEYFDDKSWARDCSLNYYREYNKNVGFLSVYYALLESVKKIEQLPATFSQQLKEALKNRKHFDSDSNWARASARAIYHENKGVVKFVEIYKNLLNELDKLDELEDTPDTLEFDLKDADTKKKVNAILYKEFDDWYEPFITECLEDDDQENCVSAPLRLKDHMEKVLCRRMKCYREDVEDYVYKWIQKRLDTYQSPQEYKVYY